MNLKEYGENELALRVLNCEGSYNYMIEMIELGHSSQFITEQLADGYEITDAQFDDMKESVEIEMDERRG